MQRRCTIQNLEYFLKAVEKLQFREFQFGVTLYKQNLELQFFILENIKKSSIIFTRFYRSVKMANFLKLDMDQLKTIASSLLWLNSVNDPHKGLFLEIFFFF